MGRQNILELEASGTAAPLKTVLAWNARALRTLDAGSLAHAPPRALALVHTCMYNAWAAYDGNARQTVHGVAVRLPHAERDAATFTDVANRAGPGPGQESGRKIGARVFDKARRYWQGKR
jgi:hypothetical protein